MTCPQLKRFLTGKEETYEKYIQAAKEYVGKAYGQTDKSYLYTKPYEQGPGNGEYFSHMYNVLNLIKAMRITPNGRVLEVGCGPGWVTEILMALGFTVDALEPCEEFVEIAREKIVSFQKHLRLINPPTVTIHCRTLEEFNVPDNTYDGIIFYAALHHVVDEVKGLENCYKALKVGGVIGINEGAWKPGDRTLEQTLEKEMQLYGVLENPFTIEYLDYLLETVGFKQIVRYNEVNGLFPSSVINDPVKSILTVSADDTNIITAVKRLHSCKTTQDPEAATLAEITVVKKSYVSGVLRLTVKLKNVGETIWLTDKALGNGWVTLALVNKVTRAELGRSHLNGDVAPGEETMVEMMFNIENYSAQTPWCLDLVNEGYFWLESRGVEPVLI